MYSKYSILRIGPNLNEQPSICGIAEMGRGDEDWRSFAACCVGLIGFYFGGRLFAYMAMCTPVRGCSTKTDAVCFIQMARRCC